MAPSCRRSSWLVVAPSCLPSGIVVGRVRPVWFHPPLIVLLIVPLIVFSPRLACREAGRRAWRVLSFRVARCLGCRPLGSVRLPWGRIVLFVCLLAVSVPAGGALPLAWRVVAACPFVPVARAAYPLRVRLSVGSAVLTVRLVVGLAAPVCLLGGGVRRAWASRACVSLSPDTHFAPLPL